MRGLFKILAALFAAIAALCALPGAALAQQIKPLEIEPDESGVNLLSGQVAPKLPTLSVPGAGNLTYTSISNLLPYMSGNVVGPEGGQSSMRVNRGGTSASLTCLDNDCKSANRDGSSLTVDTMAPSATFVQGGSARTIFFSEMYYWWPQPPGYGTNVGFYPSWIQFANGEKHTFTYDKYTVSGPIHRHRPNKVVSNLGYEMHISYQSNTQETAGWRTPHIVTIYKSSNLNTPLARHTYSGTTVTDLAGRAYGCGGCDFNMDAVPQVSTTSLTLPGEGSPTYSATASSSGSTNVKPVGQVVREGATWTYSYQNLTHVFSGGLDTPKFSRITASGPLGFTRSADIWHPADIDAGKVAPRITSITNGLNQTTSFTYGTFNRLTKITLPEGNSIQVTYDLQGNITERRVRNKAGGGDLVETASYPDSGWDMACFTADCFLPNWTRDPAGNQTDYTWDSSHGGLLTRLDPADQGGQRRKLKIQYDGQNRPIREETCATNSAGAELTCGTAGSFVKQTTYWENTRLPATIIATDGVGTGPLTTAYTYDPAGRLLSVDPPLPGNDDALFYRYDAAGRKTWDIGAKGTDNYRLVTRTFYRDADDQVTRVESGRISGDLVEATYSVFRESNISYDARRLPVTASLVSSGVTYSLTQTSYDARNRKVCTATRMNPAVWGSLPASACTLGTQGSDGPDRITQTVYDAENQVLQVRKAVGTPIEIADVTYDYTTNGKTRYVIDANGNRAEYRYDGHDRQVAWMFPSPSRPSAYNPATQATALASAGAVNEGDYEAYTYDANGNRITLRKRDGSVLAYSYDALNRMTLKVVPERAGLSSTHTRDVYYGYDIRGLQTYARFDGPSGEGVTNGYDMYGRKVSEGVVIDGVSRVIWSGYNNNGARLVMQYPDGNYAYYHRNALGGIYYAQSNVGPLFYPPYNDDGSVNWLYRWQSSIGNWGSGDVATDYNYDPAGRLNSMAHHLAGASYDTTTTFTRNPASQLTSVNRSNDNYAWTGAVNVDRGYTTNGLNQYTAGGPAVYGYDANGNLTSDGGDTYLYDIENRLVSRSGGAATLRYDPLGRLYEVAGAWGTTRFLHDGDALVGEYDTAGNLLRRYVHGDSPGDDPLVWFEGAGMVDSAKRYLFADERGSVVAVTDANGNALAINSYDEFGIPAATNQGRFQYTGQAWIPELGLFYYKARMYSPTLGRFMQTDPIGYEDGPNIYAYVANDPVNAVDPEGKWIVPLIRAAIQSCAKNATCQGAAIRAGQAIKRGVDRITRRDSPEPPRRQPPNPHGSKGKPDHQREVARQERIAQEEAGPDETVVRERKAPGMDVDRRPDVQTRDSSGNTVRVREVERQPDSKRVQDKREDYQRNGIKCDVVDCNGNPR